MMGTSSGCGRGRCIALGLLLLACAPVMVERDGHRVFNPAWLPVLDGARRDAWQRPEEVLDALAIPAGAVVADVGAGSGYFAERLARRVGATGRVYATDVQDEMLAALERRVAGRGLVNVEVVRAAFDDPTLPPACCDLVFFSSVYKEIDGRVAYMAKVRRLLRPAGRVAILEFRPDAGFGPPARDRLAPQQVARELAEAGFRQVAIHDFLPRQYLLEFVASE